MEANKYNLDDVNEYFEFVAKGHRYRFKYLTADELKKMNELGKDDKNNEEAEDYLSQFITKLDENSPDFKDVYRDFNFAQIKRFKEMVTKEFSVD